MITNNKPNSNSCTFTFLKYWRLPIAIFLLALAVRVPGLGEFLTSDEKYWVDLSRSFTSGLLFDDYMCSPEKEGRQFHSTGWGCTFQAPFPAVSVMWMGSLGLLTHYWQTIEITGIDLRTFLDNSSVEKSLIAPIRLPITILNTLFIPFYYILVRRLLSNQVALIATLLVALHPFHIALSRILHHDALTTTFMIPVVLILIGYWFKQWSRYWLLLAGVLTGFALLTKPVTWFILPYTIVLGGLILYHYWYHEVWQGWRDVWRLVGEMTLLGCIAILIFVVFFPAMWVAPLNVIYDIYQESMGLAQAGHKHYFLGQISGNPGPLFYPVGWLLRSSPLEIIGLLALLVAMCRSSLWHSLASLHHYLLKYPIFTALAVFIGMFLLFEVTAPKKMVRYFLPAFPVIDIFVALGLLWLADALTKRTRHKLIMNYWKLPLLSGVILFFNGWLILDHWPYYFTYYNPLFGGSPVASRLMSIEGWGEGLNEAAAYVNQQPDAESLLVISWMNWTVDPFFVGQVRDYTRKTGDNMEGDYLFYYHHQWQRNQQKDMDVWLYFTKHYSPAHKITMHGIDYVLIYRNPIQHHINWQSNGLQDVLNLFGYNLLPSGDLTLFWQNVKPEINKELWLGLSPSAGGETKWTLCTPTPEFSSEVNTPKAILESLCPLTEINNSSGLYDIHLRTSNGSNIFPIKFPAGRLAISIDAIGQFQSIDPGTGFALMLEQQLPKDTAPLDITFSSVARLVGYKIDHETWRAGQTGQLTLYWQPLMEAGLITGLVQDVELVLHLSANNAETPILTVTEPIFPEIPAQQYMARANVIPMSYSITLPSMLSAGEYILNVCPKMVSSNQSIPGIAADTIEPVECVKLPITISMLK